LLCAAQVVMRGGVTISGAGISFATGGPPNYSGADITTNVYQLASPLPSWGDPLHGASGTCATVTNMASPTTICRVTNFDNVCGPTNGGQSGLVATTLDSDEVHFSPDDSLVWLGSTGGGQCVYLYNGPAQSVQKIGQITSSTGGAVGVANLIFSKQIATPKVIYSNNSNSNAAGNASRGQILSWDFTGLGAGGGVPTPGTVYNFIQGQSGSWGTTSANCLPTGYSVTWTSSIRESANGQIFAMGFSNNGGQNTGFDVVVYKVGSGCIHLNTNGLTITGDWGVTTANGLTNEHFNVHNVNLSGDGTYVIISWNVCVSGTCTPPFNYDSYIWVPSTGLVTYDCNNNVTGSKCSGHGALGYTSFTNASSATAFQEEMRLFAGSPNAPTDLKSSSLVCSPYNWLVHNSWVNGNSSDTLPVVDFTYNSLGLTGLPSAPFVCAYTNEIDLVPPQGFGNPGSGPVLRETQIYNSGIEGVAALDTNIGAISQTGKYMIWTSDGMGQFGSTAGAESCTIGSSCRGDVLGMILK